MTAYNRPLARLPLEVFEPFVATIPLSNHDGTCRSQGSEGGDLAGEASETEHLGAAVAPPACRRPLDDDGTSLYLRDSATVLGDAPDSCVLRNEEIETFLNENEGCSTNDGVVATQQHFKRRRVDRDHIDFHDNSENPVFAAATTTAATVTKTPAMTVANEFRRQICSKLISSTALQAPMTSSSRGRPTHGGQVEHEEGAATGPEGGATDDEENCHDAGTGANWRDDTDARPGASTTTSSSLPASSTATIRTVGQLLSTDVHDLMRKLDPLLTADECRLLLQRVASHSAPPSVSAWSLLKKIQPSSVPDTASRDHSRTECRYVSTCIPTLDGHLRGGMEMGRIFEVYGASGTGKTQLALTASVQNVIDHRCATMYIGTTDSPANGPLPRPNPNDASRLVVQRLREIAENRLSSAGSAPNVSTTATVLSNIVTHTVSDATELLHCIDSLEEEIVMRTDDTAGDLIGREICGIGTEDPVALPVSLIVVDSLAQPLLSASLDQEADANGHPNPTRAGLALAAAQQLKRIAIEHSVAVLVVNHVDMVQNAYGGGTDAAEMDGSLPSAALGTAWHHCVSTRVALQHCPIQAADAVETKRQVSRIDRQPFSTSPQVFDRTAVLTKSSVVHCPAGPFDFAVLASGVTGAV